MAPPSSHDGSSPCIRRDSIWEAKGWDRCSHRPVPHIRSLVAPCRNRIIDDHWHLGDWSAYQFQLQRRSRVVNNWMRLTISLCANRFYDLVFVESSSSLEEIK